MKLRIASAFLLGLSVILPSTNVSAEEPDDVFVLQSITQVTNGVAGGLIVAADNVVLRQGTTEYPFGKFMIQISAGALPGCLDTALRASSGGRFIVRVRQNSFATTSPSVSDKFVVKVADLKSCAFAK